MCCCDSLILLFLINHSFLLEVSSMFNDHIIAFVHCRFFTKYKQNDFCSFHSFHISYAFDKRLSRSGKCMASFDFYKSVNSQQSVISQNASAFDLIIIIMSKVHNVRFMFVILVKNLSSNK